MDIIRKIAQELEIRAEQVQAVVSLIDEGNTIPFIARYRKEMHGALDDEVLRNLDERLKYLRGLEEKKESVLKSMETLGVLTPELAAAMEEAETLAAVEDIYRPYRPKRRTRAVIAKEKGLEPLAVMILQQKLTVPVEEAALPFVSEEKEVPTGALSMGVGTICEAKKIILLAFGKNKADAVKGMVEGGMTQFCTASALQAHNDTWVFCDEEAASKLKLRDYYAWRSATKLGL